LVYRTGISHNHHIEASGGTDKATFNAGWVIWITKVP
jgi:hypothetical protein